METVILRRKALISSAIAVSACTTPASHIAAASEMDGCYVRDGHARLAIRDGALFAPQGTRPLATAHYRLLPSGAFVWTGPEVLTTPDGSLMRQAPESHRLVPLQRTNFGPTGTRIRLLFPKSDGFGFQILYRDQNSSC